MKKLTNLLLAGIGGVKVQFKWQGKNESNWITNVAVLGLHSPVMMSRHQENLRKFDACRDRDHKLGS